jgi:pheromone shutdown protein TraB
MYNIVIICTQHKQSGNCNSIELHKIVERLQPDVIFEELSDELFDESYRKQKLWTLETDAIKLYLKDHAIQHIAVDTYALPKYYHEDIERLYNKFFRSNMLEDSRMLCNLLDYHKQLIFENGFDFLNSDKNTEYFTSINVLKERILKVLDDEYFFQVHALEKEVIARRENQIVKNIYNFSKTQHFNRAVMCIGSGHRKSIWETINKFETQESPKLNWQPYLIS